MLKKRFLIGFPTALMVGFILAGMNFPAFSAPLKIDTSPPLAAQSPRTRLLADFGWRFQLGDTPDAGQQFDYPENDRLYKALPGDDEQETKLAPLHPDAVKSQLGEKTSWVQPGFDDTAWRSLNLPHDWVVELPFDKAGNKDHGYKAIGPNIGNMIGWYRRTFDLPAEDKNKVLSVEFDGVYRNCIVWVNGHCLGRHLSGYGSFLFDITPYANFGGKNVLAVRVDATRNEGWFYEGAGIYRHVWLVKTSPSHVAHWGTQVISKIEGNGAKISIETLLKNGQTQRITLKLISSILDSSGKGVAESTQEIDSIPAGGEMVIKQTILLTEATFWSLENPYLYKLVSRVELGGKVVDSYETPFGVRSIRFDAEKGFFLNGKHVIIKGVCNHQDHAGVGIAVPDRLNTWRLEQLKTYGVNAYRPAHGPPTPELLDACDRLGLLVMDEHRRMGNTPEIMSQLESLVQRDRNHPSIFLWNIGNEEMSIQGSDKFAGTVAKPMQDLAHKLDPTRPVTVAMNWDFGKGFSKIIDVQGFNYRWNGYQGKKRADRSDAKGGFFDVDQFHAAFAQKPAIGTEESSAVSTRGIYETDRKKSQVSAYDVNLPRWGEADREWGSTAEGWWNYYLERPWLAGAFVWTGFDYRGEPTPYSWPSISSQFGFLDTCGFPKDNAFFYKAWWSDQPVLHLLPHWNWKGQEGKEIAVWVHSNYEAVELFLNGKSMGRQQISRNKHLEWKVAYTPGTLEARGYKNGKVVETAKVETTDTPARLVITSDSKTITADGRDVAVISVTALDNKGRPVPIADNLVSFEIRGGGKIIGVGNGDPNCHESDKASQRSLFNGLAQVIVQSTREPGNVKITASAMGLQAATADIRTEISTHPLPLLP